MSDYSGPQSKLVRHKILNQRNQYLGFIFLTLKRSFLMVMRKKYCMLMEREEENRVCIS